MRLSLRLYGLATSGLGRIAPLVAGGESKLARGVRGRQRAGGVLAAWAEASRDPARPLVWFHAPSVGEGLQAEAVLGALVATRPELQSVFTHFSPSAEALARRFPVDVAGYVPWDEPTGVARALEAVRPDLLVFTKTEVWPLLSAAAAERGAPSVLVAATLPGGAGRLRWPARTLLAPTFGGLASVAAISAEDGARFRRLGVAPQRIEVTGDPGMDAAAERARDADPNASYLAPFHALPAPTVVAGSTWRPDEDVLLPAVTRLRGGMPGLRLVIAPHEPTASHAADLRSRLEAHGWRVALLGEVEERGGVGEAEAIVVDRVGVLAHLYTVGTVALVGGGFHDHGLHSVLEPAAARLPMAFGPRYMSSRAAQDLIQNGGARSVDSAEELEETFRTWLSEGSEYEGSAAAAFDYIGEHLGASERTARMLTRLLPPA